MVMGGISLAGRCVSSAADKWRGRGNQHVDSADDDALVRRHAVDPKVALPSLAVALPRRPLRGLAPLEAHHSRPAYLQPIGLHAQPHRRALLALQRRRKVLLTAQTWSALLSGGELAGTGGEGCATHSFDSACPMSMRLPSTNVMTSLRAMPPESAAGPGNQKRAREPCEHEE